MTDQEKLEKLKKEVAELTERKHLLIIQVREQEALKVFATEEAKEAKKTLEDIKVESDKRVRSASERADSILREVIEKDSKLTSELQEVKRREEVLDEIQKSLDANILSLSVRRNEAERAIELKELEATEKLAEAEGVLADAVKTADSKIRALSLENSRNEDLLTNIEAKQKDLEESEFQMNETLTLLNSQHKNVTEKLLEINKREADIVTRENDSSQILGNIKAFQTALERRESAVKDSEKIIHDKEVSLDIKRREIELLDKKVQSLINIHRLEAEIKGHASNG